MSDKPKDCWETPPDFWAWIARNFDPGVDICATKQNAKCALYSPFDSNNWPWRTFNCVELSNGVIWCNPGYSDLRPWVRRAIEAAHDGYTVLLLTHDNWNAEWFRLAYAHASEVYLLIPRIHFLPAPGVEASTPRNNNMLFVLRPEGACAMYKMRPIDWTRENIHVPGPRGCTEEVFP